MFYFLSCLSIPSFFTQNILKMVNKLEWVSFVGRQASCKATTTAGCIQNINFNKWLAENWGGAALQSPLSPPSLHCYLGRYLGTTFPSSLLLDLSTIIQSSSFESYSIVSCPSLILFQLWAPSVPSCLFSTKHIQADQLVLRGWCGRKSSFSTLVTPTWCFVWHNTNKPV